MQEQTKHSDSIVNQMRMVT